MLFVHQVIVLIFGTKSYQYRDQELLILSELSPGLAQPVRFGRWGGEGAVQNVSLVARRFAVVLPGSGADLLDRTGTRHPGSTLKRMV